MDTHQLTASERAQIIAAFQRIPPTCRRAFILVRYKRMRVKDVADILGIPPARVELFCDRVVEYLAPILRGSADSSSHCDDCERPAGTDSAGGFSFERFIARALDNDN